VCQQATLTRVADPRKPGSWQGRLELLPGPAEYPGAVLQPVVRDFTGFHRLCWFFSTEGRVRVVFSVRSGRDEVSLSNHYQFARIFDAGEHRVEVDLAAIALQAQPGPLDLSNIIHVQVFSVRPQSTVTIYVKRIWLEGS
jgi:hypothetical protein